MPEGAVPVKYGGGSKPNVTPTPDPLDSALPQISIPIPTDPPVEYREDQNQGSAVAS